MNMAAKVNRVTVELSPYPDLVVIYLGMRVNSLRGLWTLLKFGPRIAQAAAQRPEGLLAHEGNILFSLFPLHAGMRQYWRDFESLEAWARSLPHQTWWVDYVRDTRGTGFWHEAYFRKGGMEAIYDNLPWPLGLQLFAPNVAAHGAMFSARKRAGLAGEGRVSSPVAPD